MENRYLSLLYPSEEKAMLYAAAESRPKISDAVCDELGLTELFSLKNSVLSEYFTSDAEVIRYRQSIIADMLAKPEIGETLNRVLPILFDILEIRSLDTQNNSTGESYLYSITEIELYVSCVNSLYTGFSELRDAVKSEALSRLFSVVFELAESDYYKELNQKLKELSSRVHEIRSITVGVNLDSQLRPSDAGVLSVNAEPFKSGKMLDKILRMSFKNDAFTCIAALQPFGKTQTENRKEALTSAFNGAIAEVFRGSVQSWRKIAGAYVLENTDFLLRLLPEIEFFTRAVALVKRLEAHGNKTVFPTVLPIAEKAFDSIGIYNPAVALEISEPVVTNDFAFDDNGRIYILTGPNRGGKSVITCAVGIAQAMLQLGLPVPAEKASISPVDGMYTHFPEGADDTIDKGRLGEECARLRTICNAVTADSMVLLDESLSSTGAYEAAYIAAEVLSGFGAIGCRGIFATHLHELAASTETINELSHGAGGVTIDNLVAGIEEGKRSFKVYRKRPDGKSYARDIAEQYGLSFKELTKNRG